MKADVKEKVIQKIYRRHPFMNGVKPTMRSQTRKLFRFFDQKIYRFTFKKGSKDSLTGVPQSLTVTTSKRGRIIKTVTSR